MKRVLKNVCFIGLVMTGVLFFGKVNCSANILEGDIFSLPLLENEQGKVTSSRAISLSTFTTELPASTQTSTNGYFTIHHYGDYDELVLNNPTTQDFENKQVWVLVVYGPRCQRYEQVGDFSLRAGESKTISTSLLLDGENLTKLVLVDPAPGGLNDSLKNPTESWKISASETGGSTSTGSTGGANSSLGQPIFEVRGFEADDVALHYHTTVFPASIKKLKVRMILTDYAEHEYIYKTLGNGTKNALSSLCFNLEGAFEHACVSDIHVIENPSDGTTEGEHNDYHNKSIFELTFTDIDTTQASGSFTLKAGANCFGKEYKQTLYFEGVSLKNTTPSQNILDKDCGATPSYTLHMSVDNGEVADIIRTSDISFTGELSDCVATNVAIDDDCKGFTLKFKKTNVHYVSGASKVGTIVLAPNLFLYVLKNADGSSSEPFYSTSVNIGFVDPFVPAIEYDSKNSQDVSFNGLTAGAICGKSGPKIIGDILKECVSGDNKVALSALCKGSAFIGVGLDILFSFINGNKPNAVMEQLKKMDQKLDAISDSIDGLYKAVYEASERTIAMDQLNRLDTDTKALCYTTANIEKFRNAEEAIVGLSKGGTQGEDDPRVKGWVSDLQALFSTEESNYTTLDQFKTLAADIGGFSSYAALNGTDIFKVYNDYTRTTDDWKSPTTNGARQEFLEQIKNQYALVSTYFLFAIGFDKELNEDKMTTYQTCKQTLNAVDESKLTEKEKEDVNREKTSCDTEIDRLQRLISMDEILLSQAEDENPMVSVEKANKIIYDEIDNEQKAIDDERSVIEKGICYSNRIGRWIKSHLNAEHELGLWLCYEDPGRAYDSIKYAKNEIDEAKQEGDGAVHDKSTLLSQSELDTLNNSARIRKYNSLLDELLKFGFTKATGAESKVFSGHTNKGFDDWGGLFAGGGYICADVFWFGETTFDDTFDRVFDINAKVDDSVKYKHMNDHKILFLQYGG